MTTKKNIIQIITILAIASMVIWFLVEFTISNLNQLDIESLIMNPRVKEVHAQTQIVGIIREDCTGYTNCFTSLNDWETNYGGIDFGACAQGDLVCADAVAVARISGTWTNPDASAVTIDGWTTDATRYIDIHTTATARHNGIYTGETGAKAGAYRIEPAESNDTRAIQINEDYVRIDGIQAKAAIAGARNTSFIIYMISNSGPGSSDIRISNNIVVGEVSGSASFHGGIVGSGTGSRTARIWNNIVYDITAGTGADGGIWLNNASDEGYVYNNTIYNCSTGIRNNNNGMYAKNNLVALSTTGYSGTFNSSSSNNASSDGTAPGSNQRINQTFAFADETNNDFHLTVSDTGALDYGIDLSSDVNLSFADDIDGEARPLAGGWDIGADEIYVCDNNSICDTGETMINCPNDCIDTEAPTIPQNLSAMAITYDMIGLTWDASTDNAAVTGYRIYRDTIEIDTTSDIQYLDIGLSPETTYTYTVSAYDGAGNQSGQSDSDSATTPSMADIFPPERANGSPTGALPSGTTQATLSLTTNENSTCKYDLNPDTSYDSMSNTFSTTGGTTHSQSISGLSDNNDFRYYVRCRDSLNNENIDDYLIFFTVVPEGAAIFNAASCSQSDVQAAINDPAVVDGDYVVVPAGECTWDTPIVINPMPGITIQGAGIDQTKITNGLTTNNWMDAPLWIVSEQDRNFRITGIEFLRSNSPAEDIHVRGTCKNWRIDHCKFDYNIGGQIMIEGYTFGVIDNCDFILGDIPGQGSDVTSIFTTHNGWGAYGDNSFTNPLYLGTEKAIYVEDCTFYNIDPEANTAAVDSQGGARYVFRYNTLNNTYILTHGNSTNTRTRGSRSFEIYENTFIHSENQEAVFAIRGGTGIIFNNTAVGNYTYFTLAKLFRAYVTNGYTFACNEGAPYYEWRCRPHDPCDGDSVYDGNFMVYSGSHTELGGQTVLTDNNASWTTDEWKDYMITNITDGTSGFITANTVNTITANCCELDWDINDAFEIVDSGGVPIGVTGVHQRDDINTMLVVNSIPAGWEGYSLPGMFARNLSDNSEMIIANSGVNNTESYSWLNGRFDDDSCNCQFSWDNGDSFIIRNGYPCLDQVGRGTDSGEGTLQASEPLYEWNNILNGSDGDIAVPVSPDLSAYIQPNRDYYNDVPQGLYADIPSTCEPYEAYWATDQNTLYKCTATDTWESYYTPYTYPHPLTVGGTLSSCSSLGGSCCSSGYSCSGGSYSNSSDCGTLCCVGGSCQAPPSDTTPPTGSIVVNSGDIYTNSENVFLTLSASDPSGVTQMVISNTNTFNVSLAEAYNTAKSWVLPIGDGTKSVYAWFKDTVGNWNVSSYSDSIILDTVSPTISNIVQGTPTTDSITITWNTAVEASTSRIEYGLTTAYGLAKEDLTLVNNHLLALTGLSAGTTYNYKVVSADAAGNSDESINRTFTTTVLPDSTPPADISDLSVPSADQTSADIIWTAPGDDGTTGTAYSYDIRISETSITDGSTPAQKQAWWDQAVSVPGMTNPLPAGSFEQFTITGLEPHTLYYIAVRTRDEIPNWSGLSNILQAITQHELLVSLSAVPNSGTAPVNNVSLTANVSGTVTGSINYTFYCNRSDIGVNITLPYDHKLDNTNLETYSYNGCSYANPGTYTAKVIVERDTEVSTNGAVIVVSSPPTDENPIVTPVSVGSSGGGSYIDNTPPNQPANFKAYPADSQITLKWENPKDYDFVRVKILRKTGSTPKDQNDSAAIVIYEGKSEQYTDINLDNNTIYFYSIFAYDRKPNYSRRVSVSSQPIAGKTSVSIKPKEKETIILTEEQAKKPYKNGSILTSAVDEKIYLIVNNEKRWITDPKVFVSYGLIPHSQITVSKDVLDMYPEGPKIGEPSLKEGTLIRGENDFKVYIIKPPFKRHIFNPDIFNMYGHFSWNSIKQVAVNIVSSYITSDLYRALNDYRVYSLEEIDEASGKAVKHHLDMTPEQFISKGYDWSQIFIVNEEERDYYETGEDLRGE